MKAFIKRPKWEGGNSHRSVKTASLLVLTVVFALVLSGAASAGTPLAVNQTGTVSGDLYVNTSDGWPSSTQGATNEVTQANTLPTYTSIDSAMVYVNVYSGSGSNNWPVRTTVKLDGNGDGDYDDAGELLGVEDMNIPGSPDGTVYWLNDHCNRVYSDYQVWYDVKNLITSNNPTLYVKTETMGGDGYDGRIKLLALCVAYNDGDTDKVDYWVLNGQDWINAATSPSTSTFNTSSFNVQFSSATLNTVALASTDGTYTLNNNTLTGNLTETGSYYKEHQWDVTSNVNAGVDTTLTYANIGASFKINLSTLTIREAPLHVLADTPWPKFGGNNQNTGQSAYNGPSTSNLVWTYATGGVIQYGNSAAIGTDGTIYIGSRDTKLYALNHDGTLKWSYTTGGYVQGSAAIGSDGTVYFGSRDTKLYALNPDGTLKWSYTTGNYIISSPAIAADGTVYFGSGDTKLYALNPDGTLKLTYTTGGNIRASPAIAADGTVYIGSNDQNLYAINPDGTLKWTYGSGSHNDYNVAPAIGTDGTVYIGRLDLYSPNKKFSAINPDGTLKWNYITARSVQGSPAIAADGTIYVGCSGGTFYAFNPDGTLKWTYGLSGSNIYGAPVVDSDGTIYIESTNATYAFNPDGTLKWTYGAGGSSSPAIGADGTLYIGVGSSLYAFRDVVSEAPVANFTVSSNSGAVPSTVNFTDSSTGVINSWAWDFNGDGIIDSTLKNPTYTYNTSGNYTVTLTATNTMGSSTKTDYITVTPPPAPVVDFIAAPLSGVTPVTVQFTDQSTGRVTSWTWDFNNDGIIDSTVKNPTWNYTTAGNYTVKLTVSNEGGTDDEVKSDYINVLADTEAPVVSASPVGGTFTTAQLVNLTAIDNIDPNPVIFYTCDGSDPTASSTQYTGSISIPATSTLKFIAVDMNGNVSPVQTESYTIIDTEAPNVTVSPAGGTYTTKTWVTLTVTDNVDPNPVIYYTLDGSDPTASSTRYTNPINIPATANLKFIAVDASGNISPVQTENYIIDDTQAPIVTDNQTGTTVTLTATDNVDPNPKIYYTTDGTDPTTSSTPYSGPFTIPQYTTTVVKFIATDASGNTSPVQSKTYSTYTGERYNGGRYSVGTDLVNTTVYREGNIGVRVVEYGSYTWFTTTGTATYTASDLNLPEGATIRSARLYQGWTWYGYPGFTVAFNGHEAQNPTMSHSDCINGQDVFDVTSYFNTTGDNTAVITGGRYQKGNYATVLIVVYEAPIEPYQQIWVNEGSDCLLYDPATGYTIFNNVTTTGVVSAKITTVLESGDTNPQNTILFNNQSVPLTGSGGVDPVFKYYDVTSALKDGANELGVTAEDYLNFSNAIMVITKDTTAPTVAANPISGVSNTSQTVTLAATDDHDITPDIYYTLNGDTPTTSSTLYSGPITLTDTTTLKFFAVDNVGNSSNVQSETYTIELAPVADFTATPTTGTAPLSVTFTNTSTDATTYQWDFNNDGTTDSTNTNPTWIYNTAGTYTVKLTATGPGGSDDEIKTNYITVNEPAPVAQFTGTPTTGTKPLQVTFTNQSTGNITSYAWDFDNNGTTDSNDTNPTWTYSTAGNYTVKLTTTGPGGSDDEIKTNYITVNEPVPVAQFVGTPTSGTTPLQVAFTNQSTNATSYQWDFDNNGTTDSTDTNPTWTYSNAGTYTVKLTTTGPGGSDDEVKTDYITVNEPVPVAQFVGTPISGTSPLQVVFTNQSTNATSYQWDFDNNGTTDSTETNPTRTYNAAGTYTVKLTATGPGGIDEEVKTSYITVSEPAPVAAFTGTSSGTSPLTVTFTNQSTNATEWAWDFNNDGTVDSTDTNPTWIYDHPGTYTVKLNVTGPGGIDEETKTDYITVNKSTQSDLLATEMKVTNNPYLNYSLVEVTITNIGLKTAGYFDLTLYDNGTQVKQQYALWLASDAVRTLSFIWSPATIEEHHLEAVIDQNNSIEESNKNNNQITLLVDNRPDLTPTALKTKTLPLNNCYVTVDVTNNGEDLTEFYDVTLYDNGTQIGQQKIYGLKTGETKTVTFLCKLTGSNTHNLQATTDATSTIPETNETNNTLAKTL